MIIDYEIDDFPSCCGAMILHAFPFVEAGDLYEDLPDQVDIKTFDTQLKKNLEADGAPAFAFAILTSNQRDVFGDRMIKAGFQCVRRGVNPNTGNMLYVYVRGGQAVRPPKSKAKPKKRK
jgi:hypothetical protein